MWLPWKPEECVCVCVCTVYVLDLLSGGCPKRVNQNNVYMCVCVCMYIYFTAVLVPGEPLRYR